MLFILSELKKFTLSVVLIVLSFLGAAFCFLSLPNFLQTIVDAAIPASDIPAIYNMGLIMLALGALGTLLCVYGSFLSVRISSGIGLKLRQKVVLKTQALSIEQAGRFGAETMAKHCVGDILCMQEYLLCVLRAGSIAAGVALSGVFFLFRNNHLWSSLCVLAALIVILVMFWQHDRFRDSRIRRALLKSEEDQAKTFSRAGRSSRFVFTVFLSIPSFIVIGSVWLLQQTPGFTMGELFAAVLHAAAVSLAFAMLSVVAGAHPSAAVASARIAHLLNLDTKLPNFDADLPSLAGIEFRDVSYTYPGAESPAVSKLSFSLQAGQTAAVVGDAGSGKSTLLRLIPRLLEAQAGEILINGTGVRGFSPETLHAKIAYVPQQPIFFDGTLSENLSFCADDPSQKRIKRAAETAQVLDAIYKQPNGLDTVLTQNASAFSDEQRGRLSIARAVMRKPELYLLDEALLADDSKRDAELCRSLRDMNATVVFAAKSASKAAFADQIIVLDAGRVAGVGTHDALMRSCPFYQRLADSEAMQKEAEKSC